MSDFIAWRRWPNGSVDYIHMDDGKPKNATIIVCRTCHDANEDHEINESGISARSENGERIVKGYMNRCGACDGKLIAK